ncbi:MAG: glycoside hydrolase family 3 protein [Lachnospiraceae bacterium]|nr:glycoside hydrolase family 3 protein [Lachnospiraceae bacterium]
MVNLKAAPFYLQDEDIQWVEQTKKQMTLDEKIGQLFCPIGYSSEPDYLDHFILAHHIGGILYRCGEASEMQQTHRYLQEHSRIPLLIAANLEAGGNGIAENGTYFGKQMQIAATDNDEQAYRLGKISCSEGGAVGCNWAFAPVVDIDYNWRNPITNVRTYGNDPERVLRMAKEFKRGADEEQMAVAVKHFPGDGMDEVDQHILTSVNSMSRKEWDATYGKIYQGMIDDGSLSIMVGHIALPDYQEFYSGKKEERLIPATLSKELLQNLLREKLGFNGLICTDATPMVGFCCAMKRELAVPTAIASGCDMFLFNKDLHEDYEFMKAGYEKGIITDERLEEALDRILGMKAALGLHKKREAGTLVPPQEALEILQCQEHIAMAQECADEAITLVKDTQQLLPISPERHKRVLLEILGDFPSNEHVLTYFKEKLEAEGFAVTVYEKENFETFKPDTRTFNASYDLVIYLGNVENASNKTTNRINWYTFWGNGNNVPWFVEEKPVMFISLANPYHLVDVPMIKTYINGYSNSDYVLDQTIEKIMGRSPFKGVNPIDPFCGKEYLTY